MTDSPVEIFECGPGDGEKLGAWVSSKLQDDEPIPLEAVYAQEMDLIVYRDGLFRLYRQVDLNAPPAPVAAAVTPADRDLRLQLVSMHPQSGVDELEEVFQWVKEGKK